MVLTFVAQEETVAGRLRKLREELGLTQHQIAERLGLTDAGYRHYEFGRVSIALNDLPMLADALGVTKNYLMECLGLLDEPPDSNSLEVIVRSLRSSHELTVEDKDILIRLVERSRRIIRGEPDPGP